MENETENNKIEKLLEKNIEMTEEVYQMTKKINKFVFWQKIFQTINILIIVVPIVLGIIYLPPLLKGVVGQYQKVLEIDGVNGNSGLDYIPSTELLEVLK